MLMPLFTVTIVFEDRTLAVEQVEADTAERALTLACQIQLLPNLVVGKLCLLIASAKVFKKSLDIHGRVPSQAC